jgi:hypothetical protein
LVQPKIVKKAEKTMDKHPENQRSYQQKNVGRINIFHRKFQRLICTIIMLNFDGWIERYELRKLLKFRWGY